MRAVASGDKRLFQENDQSEAHCLQALPGRAEVDGCTIRLWLRVSFTRGLPFVKTQAEGCSSVYKYYTNMLQNLDKLADSRYNTHH